ncbi:hypothetical protein ACIP88_05160 [Streptomyces uncialis]|uniref:hypothetical protein n=1 Tax=Streptomyces uncialis TaxID=1048205 RepID=UPI0037F60D95
MSAFDGSVYRIRSRMKHDFDGHEAETFAERFADTAEQASEIVDDWRVYGVDAVEVDLLHYVVSEAAPRLSFGDYHGDEVCE